MRKLLYPLILATACSLAFAQDKAIPRPKAAPGEDAAITARVKSALIAGSKLDPLRIDVEVRNGVVTLHGLVDSENQRDEAERIVSRVGGVHAVSNNLAVK